MHRIIPRFAAVAVTAGLLAAAIVSPALAAKDAAKDADPVVAKVNGMEIHRSDVQDSRLRLPERFRSVPLESVFGFLVNSLIDSKLIAAKARKIGLQDSPEVKKTMARIEDQILERAFMTDYIKKRITVAQLRQRYQKQVKDASAKEEIHARHILLETEAQAREVISELKNGADFAKLAKARSKGPSAVNGGDLGFFTKDQMVPAFSAAAFALKKGAFTKQPVQTQFGWHVIMLVDRRQVKPPSFKKDEARLREEVAGEIGAKLVQSIRQAATIERFNLDGTAISNAAPK